MKNSGIKFQTGLHQNQAALIEPYTIASQVCARAGLEPDDTILIHGAGPIGLMLADTSGHMEDSRVIDQRNQHRTAGTGGEDRNSLCY